MVSRSGLSGNAGKGLCSGWLTSGGLRGGMGSEPTCDFREGKWCDVSSSGEDCSVSAVVKIRHYVRIVRRNHPGSRLEGFSAHMYNTSKT